tara:strand:- start:69 stop:704 length:636 start_codon:yes stop_codon:yes gene_type:complete
MMTIKEIRNKIFDTFVFLVLLSICFVAISYWGKLCDYVIHGIEPDHSAMSIVMGYFTIIINTAVFAIFLCLDLCPFAFYLDNKERMHIVWVRVLIAIAILILLCSYPAMYAIEVHTTTHQNKPNDMFSSHGALFALSAYMKITPLTLLTMYSAYEQEKEKEQKIITKVVPVDDKYKSDTNTNTNLDQLQDLCNELNIKINIKDVYKNIQKN